METDKMDMVEMKSNRHFIVFYAGTNSTRVMQGWKPMVNTDGKYINAAAAKNYIATTLEGFATNEFVITNIVELNEEDFNTFLEQ